MIQHYILKGRTPVPVKNWLEAAQWFELSENRIIARSSVEQVSISTVFLMFDHRLFGEGPPILFETMCFADGESDIGDWMQRYTSFDAAVAGHNDIVDQVRAVMSSSKEIASQSVSHLLLKSDEKLL